MIAGGSAPGTLINTQFDPARVAPAVKRCDPDRVGVYSGPETVGAAPGSQMYPLAWIRLKGLLCLTSNSRCLLLTAYRLLFLHLRQWLCD